MSGLAEIRSLRARAAALARSFEPGLLSGPDLAVAVEELAAARHAIATVEALAAARVAETSLWRRSGAASPEEWLARATGTSTARARDALATGGRLGAQPVLAEAARRGAVSPEQAAMISGAAAANPGAERRLVEAAASGSLGELRRACERARAAADPDAAATQERIHRERRARFFVDAEGGANLWFRSATAQIARIKAALDAKAEELFGRARAQGRREPREAYLVDALEALATGTAAVDLRKASARTAAGTGFLGVIRVDLAALARGRPEGEELCEIAGVGPVPVAQARALLGDGPLALVLAKGRDVVGVAWAGRRIPLALRLALLGLDPRCRVEGCERRHVEIDHTYPVAAGGPTALCNAEPLCTHHHRLKTHHGWSLVPGTGRRAFVPPDDPRHPGPPPGPPPPAVGAGAGPPGAGPPGAGASGAGPPGGPTLFDTGGIGGVEVA